jgi:hypothetical protein
MVLVVTSTIEYGRYTLGIGPEGAESPTPS